MPVRGAAGGGAQRQPLGPGDQLLVRVAQWPVPVIVEGDTTEDWLDGFNAFLRYVGAPRRGVCGLTWGGPGRGGMRGGRGSRMVHDFVARFKIRPAL